MNITTVLVFVIVATAATVIAVLNYTYISPIVSGNFVYCNEMTDQGYFSLHDFTHHKNCSIGLVEGPSQCDWIQKKMLSEEDEIDCFNYDDYDDECKFDRADYGTRCVWGGLGWMLLGLRTGLYVMSVATIVIALASLFSKDEDEIKPEPKVGVKLVGLINETY